MGAALNIVFMGSPDFAVPSLENLIRSRHNILAVVSGPDKRRGRGRLTSPTPVKKTAESHHIPVIEADSMSNSTLAEKLISLKPDLFVVVAFKILPDVLLQIPAKGSVNLHASLLPKYRGAAPIHHAVMNGESETGCTVFKLDTGIDTGGIITQSKIPVGPDETTGSVYERLMHSGSQLLTEAVNAIADETAVYQKQDESQATSAPKLFDYHCIVDFNRPAQRVHNHIRGLSPFPCAYSMLDGKKMKLLRSTIQSTIETDVQPGAIFEENGKMFVSCADLALELTEVQYEGKRKMKAIEFLRGYHGEPVFRDR